MVSGREVDLDQVCTSQKPSVWSFVTVSPEDSLSFANDLARMLNSREQRGTITLQVRPRSTMVVFERDGRSSVEVMIR